MIVVKETAHEEATVFGDNCFLLFLSNLYIITVSLAYYTGYNILVKVLHY